MAAEPSEKRGDQPDSGRALRTPLGRAARDGRGLRRARAVGLTYLWVRDALGEKGRIARESGGASRAAEQPLGKVRAGASSQMTSPRPPRPHLLPSVPAQTL